MTLSATQRPAIVRATDTRDTNKPTWRTPVCRLVPLPASTRIDGSITDDLLEVS
ncbi:hypothetical protein [Ancylobacter rudongensis]|uniref:Uncharacterized protein n=1 Tax=Ancylobacter rudongensis TaxID=177413 RepID=A0A1G4R9M9_9HYPH|nr:hypothetical protein [Ancylobacter rudongensis]SCW52929.1 hypothetical protein SAMN05660859_1446 [Ancylobacter rudongensis]